MWHGDVVAVSIVSILTRPGGRVLLVTGGVDSGTGTVSILTRPGGRVLRSPIRRHAERASRVSILTRPGGRVLPPATDDYRNPLG